LLTAAAVATAGAILLVCTKAPAVKTPLLVLDGMEFHYEELAPYVTFLDSFVPEGGRKTKMLRVLEEHVIPLRLAQRAFAKERTAMLQSALALRSVATNVEELERQSVQMKDKRRANLTRSHALMPVAMFVFDPLAIGAVSKPLELPHGWFVVGAFDLKESPGQLLDDYVDALQVGFVTHTAGEWHDWYEAQKLVLADKASWIDPEFATAMPPWIRPPKPQNKS
jgi:hypothetical protein